MSADDISTCPSCGEGALREYRDDWGIRDGYFRCEYHAHCPECGFKFEYEQAPIYARREG